ncbi:MAG: ATP-binding cassette domain-containing protein, partial [Planctomycetes bacterium]|nr:ATP-binding cassette domain-containing protein [Planctomycetota bacterium]
MGRLFVELADSRRRTDDLVRALALTTRFDDRAVLDGVDLAIRRGEVFVIMGPSGCGKTTLLRLVAGFLAPDRGRIALHGDAVTGDRLLVPAEQRRVGMVFQDIALFPHLDVAANIGFGLNRWTPVQRRARVEELLNLVGLPGMGGRYPHQLSGGQQQRVAIARALVNRPEVLLLDEPLGALDLKLRQQMQIELKNLQREVGITFVYVTHDQEEAL